MRLNPLIKKASLCLGFIMMNLGVVFIVRTLTGLFLCPQRALMPFTVDITLCLQTTQPIVNLLITLLKADPSQLMADITAVSVTIEGGFIYFHSKLRGARLEVEE